jgi:hypothetical protein
VLRRFHFSIFKFTCYLFEVWSPLTWRQTFARGCVTVGFTLNAPLKQITDIRAWDTLWRQTRDAGFVNGVHLHGCTAGVCNCASTLWSRQLLLPEYDNGTREKWIWVLHSVLVLSSVQSVVMAFSGMSFIPTSNSNWVRDCQWANAQTHKRARPGSLGFSPHSV